MLTTNLPCNSDVKKKVHHSSSHGHRRWGKKVTILLGLKQAIYLSLELECSNEMSLYATVQSKKIIVQNILIKKMLASGAPGAYKLLSFMPLSYLSSPSFVQNDSSSATDMLKSSPPMTPLSSEI